MKDSLTKDSLESARDFIWHFNKFLFDLCEKSEHNPIENCILREVRDVYVKNLNERLF